MNVMFKTLPLQLRNTDIIFEASDNIHIKYSNFVPRFAFAFSRFALICT